MRRSAALEFQDYCAALPTWATYAVNRPSTAPRHDVGFFQFRYSYLPKPGSAAAAAAPMRYAQPGERPPSTRQPGTSDDVIDRFDSYVMRMRRSG